MRTLLHFFLFMMTINLIQLSVEAIPVQSRCNEDQQSLLLRLKETLIFNSSRSSKLINWNSSTNCCSWPGVSCTDGLVIGLDISGESISGGIDNSSILFDLQHLQSLNLANHSDFHSNGSQIPSAIGTLTNLRYLNLSFNSYFGQIPIEISHLTKLVTLDLSWNSIGSRRSSGHEINWDLVSVEIGFVIGFGVAIGSLAFYKRWRNWYYKATLNIIFKMFPQLHQRLGNRGRHVYINQRRRR